MNDYRKRISESLVQNSMPTRQVFINEMMSMLREARLQVIENLIQSPHHKVHCACLEGRLDTLVLDNSRKP